MKLVEQYRPATLSAVVGQSAARTLEDFAADPYPTCFALVGRPGTGKTSSALALAADLGCPDEFSGLAVIPAADLGVDPLRRLLDTIRLRPMLGSGWRVVVIEEFERLSPQASQLLKVALSSEHLPPRVVWVATANNVDKIDEALFERFTALEYNAGDELAAAALERLRAAWRHETDGAPEPAGLEQMGWRASGDTLRYSVRAAWDEMQTALNRWRAARRQPAAVSA